MLRFGLIDQQDHAVSNIGQCAEGLEEVADQSGQFVSTGFGNGTLVYDEKDLDVGVNVE